MPIKVLLADDHEVVRSGVASLLAGADSKIVAEAKTGAEAVKLTAKHKPDVVLLDVRLPDMDGFEVAEKILKHSPKTKIVLFTGYDNPTYVARAIAVGASDYLVKGCTKHELLKAISLAAQGRGPSQSGEMQRVAQIMNSPANSSLDEFRITPREMQVLRHIAFGLKNKEIAQSLQMSVETVKEHVGKLLSKLRVADRTQAAVLAIRKSVV